MTESNDYEWLLARERGEDVSHIPAQTRAKYRQLDQLIKALPVRGPSPGWKQRVLDAIDDPANHGPRSFPSGTTRALAPMHGVSRARGQWTWAVGSGVFATLVFAVVVFVYVDDRPPVSPVSARVGERRDEPLAAASSVAIRRGPRPHRGLGPSIGDTLVVDASTDRPIELRAYGGSGEPLARCTDTQGCSVQRDGRRRRIHFELELRSPGDVRTVAFAGESMPPSFLNLDADLEAARAANAQASEISIVHVE